ncbi:MAG: hypothetical protein HOO06_03230 [Bdellovibrionaceae bacterium]|jgi:hypothetical protein|nr:hypothetical protein [Pseudobdellovibrionaceae bacterium]
MIRLLLIILLTSQFSTALSKTVNNSVKIDVLYSESADIFDLMDNVSNWWPGFTEVEYSKFWHKKFGIKKEDKLLFKKYTAIRQKYYHDPDQKPKSPLKNRNGFFSTLGSVNADPIAEAFYSSNSMQQGLKKLAQIINKKELQFFKKFYVHFKPNYSSLISKSPEQYSVAINKVRASLNKPGISEYFNNISQFYNIKSPLSYRVIYTWWPPLNRTNASPTGKYLVMRYNPSKHGYLDDSDIVAHEIIHSISAQQKFKQKAELTNKFLNKCKVNGLLKRYEILEEPLAVVFGQLIFNKKFEPKKFSLSSNLYRNMWVSSFARQIYLPLQKRFESGEKITDGFIEDASLICNEFHMAANQLNSN